MAFGQIIATLRQRFVTPLGVGGVVLTLAALVLLAYLISLFIDTNQAVRSQTDAAREDMVWAVYQLEREANDLAFVLRDETVSGDEKVATLGKHYDILYSRTGIVTTGQLGKRFGERENLAALTRAITANIKALAPTFDALAASKTLDGQTVTTIKAALDTIRAEAAQLIIATNARHNEIKVGDRAEMRNGYNKIAWTAGGLGLVISAVIALMVVQLRQIRRLSENHRRAANEAKEANRAKSAFLAAMSHEIRTPLNGIIGMTELLDESTMTLEQKAQLGVVRHSGDVLLDIINDILDFSKLESGGVELDRTSFDLQELFEAVANIMAPRAGQKGLMFDLDAPQVVIVSDPARLRQVLINLIGNAIKFTSEGKIDVTALVIPSGPQSAMLRFRVADTGIGMSPETQAQLFREFVQGDPSINRRFGGTGLGLAICKRLAEALGGRIEVKSQLGQGTVFTVEIPCGLAAATAEATPAPRPGLHQKLRVLLVEDNPINQQVADGLLRRMGHKVTIANNGAEAVSAVADHVYDVILMDMQMPVMDGISATEHIRASGRMTPIVGLTANALAGLQPRNRRMP